MTEMIELPSDVEAGLPAHARVASRPAHELPPEEWVREFSEWVASHAGTGVVLPDEAMERESIYGDHGV